MVITNNNANNEKNRIDYCVSFTSALVRYMIMWEVLYGGNYINKSCSKKKKNAYQLCEKIILAMSEAKIEENEIKKKKQGSACNFDHRY